MTQTGAQDMDGLLLNHRLDGPEAAPPLVLCGSLGTNLEMWEPQLPLARARRLIRLDQRGHGGSPVPDGPYSIADLGRDVLATLDRLGLDRVSYCGLSIGGMIGQWLAINAPKRLHRLVLICTAAYLPPRTGWIERATTVRGAGTAEAVADAVIARWFTAPFADREPEVVARHRAMIAATPAEGYAACCEAIADMDLRPALPGVPIPALVIAGAQDPSTPPEHGRAIADAIPGARFERLDPAAHLSSVERAADVNRLIEDHLEADK
jgi:3-oxoadipate enol-lactonase